MTQSRRACAPPFIEAAVTVSDGSLAGPIAARVRAALHRGPMLQAQGWGGSWGSRRACAPPFIEAPGIRFAIDGGPVSRRACAPPFIEARNGRGIERAEIIAARVRAALHRGYAISAQLQGGGTSRRACAPPFIEAGRRCA